MPDIRAKLNQTTYDKLSELADLIGTGKTTDTLNVLIAQMHFLYCSSRWSDVQTRAAQLISTKLKFVEPLDKNRVHRVVMTEGGVHVFLKDYAQPYVLSRRLWDGN